MGTILDWIKDKTKKTAEQQMQYTENDNGTNLVNTPTVSEERQAELTQMQRDYQDKQNAKSNLAKAERELYLASYTEDDPNVKAPDTTKYEENLKNAENNLNRVKADIAERNQYKEFTDKGYTEDQVYSKNEDGSLNLVDYNTKISNLNKQIKASQNVIESTIAKEMNDYNKTNTGDYEESDIVLQMRSQLSLLQKELADTEDLKNYQDFVVQKDIYDMAKDGGDEKTANEVAKTLKHYGDGVVDKAGLVLGNTAVKTVGSAVYLAQSLYDLYGDVKGKDLLKRANNLYKNGEISLDDFNALIKEANSLIEYDSNGANQIGKQMMDASNEVQALINLGVDQPVEKFILDGLSSSAEFFAQYAVLGATGSLISAGVISASQKYAENIDNGYAQDTAMLNALLTGTLSYLTEHFGMDTFTKAITGGLGEFICGQGLNYMLKSVGQQGLSEGLEEVVEGAISPVIDSVTLGVPLEYNAGEIFYSFLVGAFSGALMGTGASLNFVINKQSQYNQAIEDSKTIKLQREVAIQNNNTEAVAQCDEMLKKINEALMNYDSENLTSNAVKFAVDKASANLSHEEVTDYLSKSIRPNVDMAVEFGNKMNEVKNRTNAFAENVLASKGINMNVDDFIALDENTRRRTEDLSNKFQEGTGGNVLLGFDSQVDANGYVVKFKNGKPMVVINPASDKIGGTIPTVTSVHELLHTIKASPEWSKIAQLAFKNEQEIQDYANELLRTSYKGSTIDEALEEAVSKKVSEKVLNSEQFIDHLAKYNTSFAYKLLYKVQGLVDTFGESTESKKVERLLTKALEKQDYVELEDGTGYLKNSNWDETNERFKNDNEFFRNHSNLKLKVVDAPSWLRYLYQQDLARIGKFSDIKDLKAPILMDQNVANSVYGFKQNENGKQHTEKATGLSATNDFPLDNFLRLDKKIMENKNVAVFKNRGTYNVFLNDTQNYIDRYGKLRGNPVLIVLKPVVHKGKTIMYFDANIENINTVKNNEIYYDTVASYPKRISSLFKEVKKVGDSYVDYNNGKPLLDIVDGDVFEKDGHMFIITEESFFRKLGEPIYPFKEVDGDRRVPITKKQARNRLVGLHLSPMVTEPANISLAQTDEKANLTKKTDGANNIDVVTPNKNTFATVSPYYKTELTKENSEQLLELSKKTFLENSKNIASALGINGVTQVNNVGGYTFENGDGNTVEQSWTFDLGETDYEKGKMFAMLMGDLGQENQESVIYGKYVPADYSGDDALVQYTITAKGIDDIDLSSIVRNSGVYDFTIKNGEIMILDFGQDIVNDIGKIIDSLGDNYDKLQHEKIKSELINREGRRDAYEKRLEQINSERKQGLDSDIEEKTLIEKAITELDKVTNNVEEPTIKFSLLYRNDSEGRNLSKKEEKLFSKTKVTVGGHLAVMYKSDYQKGNNFYTTEKLVNGNPVYLNVKNPYAVNCDYNGWEKIASPYNDGTLWSKEKYIDFAKEKGYDGIIFDNIYDNRYADDIGLDSYMVVVPFKENQVVDVYPNSQSNIKFSLFDNENQKRYKDEINKVKEKEYSDEEANKWFEKDEVKERYYASASNPFGMFNEKTTQEDKTKLYTLFKHAEELKNNIWDNAQEEAIEDIKKTFGFLDENIINPGAKSAMSMADKLFRKQAVNKNYDFDYAKDANRLSLRVRSVDELKNTIRIFKEKYGADFELKLDPYSGYTGFHITYVNNSGIVTEVQITFDFDLKQKNEAIYQKIRNVEKTLTDEERNLAYRESQDSWESYRKEFGLTPEVLESISLYEISPTSNGNGNLSGSLTVNQPSPENISKTVLPSQASMSPSPSTKYDNLSFINNPPIDNNSVSNRGEKSSNIDVNGENSQVNDNYIKFSKMDNKNSIMKENRENVREYGALPTGEQRNDTSKNNRTRIASKTPYGKTRLFARTISESTQSTTPELRTELINAINNGDFSYESQSNEKLLNNAWASLESDMLTHQTEQDLANSWINERNRFNSLQIAKGEILVSELAKSGNYDLSMKVAEQLASDLTEAGRAVQSARIYKTLTPEGKVKAIENSLYSINQRLKLEGRNAVAKLSKETKKAYLELLKNPNATDAEIQQMEERIKKEIADSVPSTLLDKINAWRYVAMLGNLKTVERNVIGNTVSTMMSGIKDVIKTGIEFGVNKATKGKTGKTSSVINPLSKTDSKLQEFAKYTFEDYYQKNKHQGKYKNDVGISKDTAFNSKLGKGLEKGVTWLMNNSIFGDTAFVRARYVNTLAQYMKANGMNENVDTNSYKFKRAQEYAWKEAERSAFHEVNEFAKFINKISKSTKVGGFVKEAVLPYTTTPFNVARQGVNYSPIGMIYHSIHDIKFLKRGYDSHGNSYSVNDYIDYIAQGATGSAIFAIGALLSRLGLFRTKDDDKDRLQNYQEDIYGEQDYSITLDNGSYTIDWLTPLIIPMALGAELSSALGDKFSWDKIGDIASAILDPLSETTMLSSLQNTLKSYGNSEGGDYLGSVITSMAENYINQIIPTAWGQIKRAFDNTRYTTYPSESELQRYGKQIANKTGIQFIENLSEIQPYINAKGEIDKNTDTDNVFMNLLYQTLSPGYYAKNKSTKYDDELLRLYNSTEDEDLKSSVLPQNKTSDITIDKNTYKLYNNDYTKYNQNKLSTANKLVEEFIDSEDYKNMTDEERAHYISKLRTYSQQDSSFNYANDNDLSYSKAEYLNAKNAVENGLKPYEYYEMKDYYEGLSTKNGDDVQSDYINHLNDSNISDSAKLYMYGLQYGKSKVYGYVNTMDFDEKTKMSIYEILADTESDKDANGKTISNSRAQKIKEQYIQLGVYDDIVKYVNENGDVDYSDFGLSKTVVGNVGNKTTKTTKTSSKNNSTVKTASFKTSNTKVDEVSVNTKDTNYAKSYASVMRGSNSEKKASQGSTKVRCPYCGEIVYPIGGKCPICGKTIA